MVGSKEVGSFEVWLDEIAKQRMDWEAKGPLSPRRVLLKDDKFDQLAVERADGEGMIVRT